MGSFFRIGIAVVFGAILVGGTLLWNKEENASEGSIVLAQTGSDTRAVRTTLPNTNWESSLEALGPVVAGTTTPFEPNGTLTEDFALQFFQDYVRTQGGNGSLAQLSPEDFVDSAVNTLVSENTDTLYTERDITIDGSGVVAMRAYGNAAALAIVSNETLNENEASILNRAIANDDPEILLALDPVYAAYSNMIADLLQTVVPRELTKEHLDLVNTLSAIHTDIDAMRQAFEDPLYAMVRVKRYEDDAAGLYYALLNIKEVLQERDISYTEEEHGSFFFKF